MKHAVEKISKAYPFGEWVYVHEQKNGVAYTGRSVKLEGSTIKLCQTEFIKGRMEQLDVKRCPKRPPTDPCTPIEHAEFRSSKPQLESYGCHYL